MPKRKASLWSAIDEALRDRRSVSAVVLISIALSIYTPLGILRVNANALASLIFPVAGTVVALALTAAGLSSSFILKLSADLEHAYQDKNKSFSREARGWALIKRGRNLQRGVMPAWRGTVFVLFSFLLSAVALVAPPNKISLGRSGIGFSIDALFSSSALGFLLVGSLWFIPAVRFSFRSELLENILLSAEAFRGKDVPSVSYLLERARAVKLRNPQDSNAEIELELCEEFKGRPFPLVDKVALGEGDAPGEIEDVTSGLSEIRRGIQTGSWKDIFQGIMRSLDQDEANEKHHGRSKAKTLGHDRLKGIEGSTERALKDLPDMLKVRKE
jgi:hypothetical protein